MSIVRERKALRYFLHSLLICAALIYGPRPLFAQTADSSDEEAQSVSATSSSSDQASHDPQQPSAQSVICGVAHLGQCLKVWMDIDALPNLEEVIAVSAIKSKSMTTDEQEVVHYADAKKGGLSTLCGITIPPAKGSMRDEEITCATCRGQLNWLAIPNRP